MRKIISFIFALIIVGCVNQDQVDLDNYDQFQNAKYEMYLHGDITEAEHALQDMLSYARLHRGKIKEMYTMEWEICLVFGRLALIAEKQNQLKKADRYWNLAVDAELKSQKEQRAWARSDPNIIVPNEDSDVFKRVSPHELRQILKSLEKDEQVAWQQ